MSLQNRFDRYIKRKYLEIKKEEEAITASEENKVVVQSIENYFSDISNEKKILLYAHEIKPLGGSILLNNIALYFYENGYRIVMLTNPNCEIDENTLHMLPKDMLIFHMRDDQEWNTGILNTIARNGVKKCLANTVISGQYTKMFKESGFSIITLVHEMTASCRILKAEQLAKNICRHSDVTVFPSPTAKNEFVEFASEEIRNKTVIRSQGLYKNSSHFSFTSREAKEKLYEMFRIPRDSIVMVGIGGINFGKGVDHLVPSLLELRKRTQQSSALPAEKNGKEYHVIWMGKVEDQAYAEWVKIEIHKAGLDDYWHWAGYISDECLYFEILNGCDVFVLPSREDTYPSVALDAASAALPIAAFKNSGGGADIAFDQHGKLAEVGDIVDYANLIEHLADDPDVTENCRLFSNEIKEKNSFINYCQSLETDFDSIFNTPGKEEPSDTSHDEREGN